MKKNIIFTLSTMLLIFQTGAFAQSSYADESKPHETLAYYSDTEITEDGTTLQCNPIYVILSDNGNALLYNQYVYPGTWENTENSWLGDTTEITDYTGASHVLYTTDDGYVILYSNNTNYLIEEYQEPRILSVADGLWQKGLPGFYRTSPDLLGFTDSTCNELSRKAQELSDKFDIAVNILIVDDFRKYTLSGSMYRFTEEVEGGYNLGAKCGTGSGILLALSMDDRDYDIDVYEPAANEIFNSYAREYLEKAMLPYLHDNDWEGGLNAYLDKCEYILSEAAAGNIIDGPPRILWLEIVIAVLTGLLIGCGARASVKHSYSKRVMEETAASNYIVDDSFAVSHKRDLYSHTTESRKYSPKSSNSGSSSGGGSRCSHSGGKF